MNDQERSLTFDARLEGRGMPLLQSADRPTGPTAAAGLEQAHRAAAGSAAVEASGLRQNASGVRKLDGVTPAALDLDDTEPLQGRASPYNVRWGIRY
jgi:hypothetical protein